MPNLRVAFAATFALSLASFAAHAEENKPGSHLHDGFYLSLAAGVGGVHGSVITTANDLHDSGSTLQSSRIDSTIDGFTFAGRVLVGGTVFPGLAIGGGHSGNILVSPTRKGNGSSSNLSTYTFGVTGPFADWYPRAQGGFHLLAMAGLSDVIENASGGSSHGLFGFGGALGAGYDFFVSDNWSFGVLGRGMLGEVSWAGPPTTIARSPANSDLSGSGLHESQVNYGGALMLTTTYQ
jgi:hypothetical protein